MNVEFHSFSLVLAEPLVTATGAIEEREGTLVRLEREDGDGPVGVGEATPLYGWTEAIEQCTEALTGAAGLVRDRGLEAGLDALDDTRAARHGLALAAQDLRAREAGDPLYRHLGGDERVESVPVNATVGDGSARETARAARDAADAGYDCVKVKAGSRSVPEDVARVRAVREELPDADLRVDANGAWDPATAETALAELAALDVAYVEQPVEATELDALERLTAESDVPVAVDETLARVPFDLVLERGAADYAILKPMALGGVDYAREYALRAREAGVTPVVTTTIDAVVARTAACHLAASLGDVPACGLATADRLAEDLADDPAPVADGAMAVPQGPGVGTRGVWER